MWSVKVVPNVDTATAVQYNRLRQDASGAANLLVHEGNTPGNTVTVNAGYLINSGTYTDIAGSTLSAETFPTTHPRIDLVYVTSGGSIAVVTGTEVTSPTVPATPSGGIPIAYIYLRVGSTVINNDDSGSNSYIIDRRPFLSTGTGAGVSYTT